MTTTPPKPGDIRICYVPMIVDHAVAVDVPDMATAKVVHDAIVTILVSQIEHEIHNQTADVAVQVFTEDMGWAEVFDFNQEI